MSGFRPRLVPTLTTLPIVLLCLALGAWQIERLHWKEGLIAAREAALAAPPVAAPATLAAARALDLHPVVADGTFLYDTEILLNTIGPNGEIGFDVLTPLREASGRIVVVDRGFVPTEFKDKVARTATGAVHVAGLLRLPPAGKPGWFRPDNLPQHNEWFWIDLPAIAAAAGIANLAPFYIDADATPNPGGWPRGKATLPALPNNHLQYAITWFSLAVAALVIYLLSQRSGTARDDRIPRT
jgi:surfeit locus 1 family protein